MLRFFCFISCCFLLGNIYSQSYSFVNYSVAQGLPQSQVSAITEDNNGYLWVGTLGGLAKFNGNSFVNFSTKEGLLNNRISSLNFIEDQLWIGHEGGVSLLEKNNFRRWAFTEDNKNTNVQAITKFKDGYVIASNGGGLFFINSKYQIRNIILKTLDQNRVRGLIATADELFIATRGGLLSTKDIYTFEEVQGTSALNISGIYKKNDEIIFSTFDNIIYKYNPNNKSVSIVKILTENSGLRNCIIDRKDNIWAVSKEGIILIDKFKKVRIINESNGLPLNAISTVFEDSNGTIWIGSEGKGMFRFPGEQFVYFDSKSGIQSDLITAGIEIRPGKYLFGTYDKGLIDYEKGKFTQTDLPSNTVWALEKDNLGNIWVGTESGFYHYSASGKASVYDEKIDIRYSKITCFYKNRLGDIWIGGSNGISKIINGKVFKIENSNTTQEVGTIRNILIYKGQLICATDKGLFSFSKEKYTRYLGISKKTFSLKTDKFDNLWIGTEEGFFWSDGNTIRQIMFSNQTSSNFINFINLYNNLLFVGTNNGLYILSNLEQKSNAKVKHYGLEEGLVNLESNINSSFFDTKGKLWFGTAQGLSVFDANSIQFEEIINPPYLNIKSIKLNFENFNYADFATKFDKNGLPLNLKLPRSKNNLIIDIDGVSLKKTKDLKYQYWMEGLEETWSPEFTNSQVTLSNLPAGHYILHIRAKNKSKVFSNVYTLEIEITPAFYSTWWFYLLIVIAATGIVLAIIQFRLKRERMRNYQETLEFKARLSSLEQQSLNASMNRHFIFNSLNSIQYFINTQDKISANRYLTNFAKLIRKNLDSSAEDNNMVSLSEEIERLELYLSLESMRFRGRFEYSIECNGIDTENILVPAMLFQPFIENSIMHGILPVEDRKGIIKIEVVNKTDYLEVILEDNGIGIDFSLNKKNNHEGDHKSQGMIITSKRIDLLKKISHKNFELEGPFQLYDNNHTINGTRVILKIPYENLDDED